MACERQPALTKGFLTSTFHAFFTAFCHVTVAVIDLRKWRGHLFSFSAVKTCTPALLIDGTAHLVTVTANDTVCCTFCRLMAVPVNVAVFALLLMFEGIGSLGVMGTA